MEREQLPLIIFVGPGGASDPERWVSAACRANACDLAARALERPCLRPIVIASPKADWASLPGGVELLPDPPGEPFHFGRRLRQVAAQFGWERLLYIGGGAGPLLSASDLETLAQRALALGQGVITNNLYSTDLLALAPVAALDRIELPASDNDLAWRLRAAGLPVESLPASAATRLDLDTPHDLAIAARHPACGPALRRLVESLPLDPAPLERVLAELRNPRGEVLVYGRTSAATWARLERLPCQTRIFSEERGMRASGRLARGEVCAWLGALLEQVGAEAFFQSLAGACTAAIMDTRPLWAHLKLWPTASDRFYADLLQPGRINDPTLRALTEAACRAPVPLLLGGQGLVSGDLLALAEIAEGK